MFAVRPEDWPRFVGAPEEEPPGRLVSSREISIEQPQATTEAWVDIAPALEHGLGHAVLIAEPRIQPGDPKLRQRLRLWLQSTRLMLDAFSDDKSLIVSATDLGTAAPLAGRRR